MEKLYYELHNVKAIKWGEIKKESWSFYRIIQRLRPKIVLKSHLYSNNYLRRKYQIFSCDSQLGSRAVLVAWVDQPKILRVSGARSLFGA